MTDVRAKFYVVEVGKTTNGGKVVMRPVTRGEDNKKWSAYTPSGELVMTIKNELAFAHFDVGDEFYLDFTKVPTESVGAEGMG